MKEDMMRRAIVGIDDELIENAEKIPVINRKKSPWVKWGTVAAAFILLLAGAFTVPGALRQNESAENPGSQTQFNDKIVEDDTAVSDHKEESQEKTELKNNIVVNRLDGSDSSDTTSIAGGIYDIAGGVYEKAIGELENNYPFINDLFVFGENTKNQRILEYRYDSEDNRIHYKGYYVIYTDHTETKGVELFFSETMKMKPRCIGGAIVPDELEDSYIHDVPVKIIEEENRYIAFFEKNDVHFDFEVTGASQEVLIDLLQSVLKAD